MDVVEPSRPRRDVLCGLVVAMLGPGPLVVACGKGGAPAGTTTTTAGVPPLAALAEVPDGGGLVVDRPGGGKLLLVRTGKEVVAYDAACTHKGTTLNPPQSGTITCLKHGAQFDAATGAVRKGPATTALAKVPVAVRAGNVVLQSAL